MHTAPLPPARPFLGLVLLTLALLLWFAPARSAPKLTLAEMIPVKPEPVLDLLERSATNTVQEVWFYQTHYFLNEIKRETLHGVQVEKKRLKDQERFDQEYAETRTCYYKGRLGPHRVVLTYSKARLVQVEYILGNREHVITREYDAVGREKPDPNGNIGNKRKQMVVLEKFAEVYGELAPSP